jgi:hypothetical protein
MVRFAQGTRPALLALRAGGLGISPAMLRRSTLLLEGRSGCPVKTATTLLRASPEAETTLLVMPNPGAGRSVGSSDRGGFRARGVGRRGALSVN